MKKSAAQQEREERFALLTQLWNEHQQLFPNDADCFAQLYRKFNFPNVTTCQGCGSDQIVLMQDNRVSKCNLCLKKRWLTADSFFDGTRLPVVWLFAISLYEKGIAFSSSMFHEVVGVAQSTANCMKKKIEFVLEQYFGDDSESVDSFLFYSLFSRRSCETPAREHPRAEQDELDKTFATDQSNIGENDDNDGYRNGDDSEDGSNLKLGSFRIGREQEALALLTENPVNFEILLARSGMDPAELSANLVSLVFNRYALHTFGDCFSLCPPERKSHGAAQLSDAAKSAIARFTQFVRGHFIGISRKYLQSYLAAYWCSLENSPWSNGRLLEACLDFGPLSIETVYANVTPPEVKCPLLPA